MTRQAIWVALVGLLAGMMAAAPTHRAAMALAAPWTAPGLAALAIAAVLAGGASGRGGHGRLQQAAVGAGAGLIAAAAVWVGAMGRGAGGAGARELALFLGPTSTAEGCAAVFFTGLATEIGEGALRAIVLGSVVGAISGAVATRDPDSPPPLHAEVRRALRRWIVGILAVVAVIATGPLGSLAAGFDSAGLAAGIGQIDRVLTLGLFAAVVWQGAAMHHASARGGLAPAIVDGILAAAVVLVLIWMRFVLPSPAAMWWTWWGGVLGTALALRALTLRTPAPDPVATAVPILDGVAAGAVLALVGLTAVHVGFDGVAQAGTAVAEACGEAAVTLGLPEVQRASGSASVRSWTGLAALVWCLICVIGFPIGVRGFDAPAEEAP